MRILHTVEFYHPSVGGAQEVVRQISEGLVQCGHEVTVATTHLPQRNELHVNGVRIQEFSISGNVVDGYKGDVNKYQHFLLEGQFDIMMNYAAQEWTMDLAFPLLEHLPYRKIMIPCGFSALYNPAFGEYFVAMPKIMRRYDHIVFHASHYRDINFARQHGIEHYSIIPNGASKTEFETVDPMFRRRYKIPEDVILILTVGSHTGQKGHRLSLDAFRKLKSERTVLVIIGNVHANVGGKFWDDFLRPLLGHIRYFRPFKALSLFGRAVLGGVMTGCLPECRAHTVRINISGLGKKRVYLLDPPREEVVAAYQAADLFIFGSNIEYSPLVLFEALASRTPFLSLACGNAAEIAAWSGGGVIAPTIRFEDGSVNGDPDEFAREIESLLNDPKRRTSLAESGYRAWQEKFTWERIVNQYEDLYTRLIAQ